MRLLLLGTLLVLVPQNARARCKTVKSCVAAARRTPERFVPLLAAGLQRLSVQALLDGFRFSDNRRELARYVHEATARTIGNRYSRGLRRRLVQPALKAATSLGASSNAAITLLDVLARNSAGRKALEAHLKASRPLRAAVARALVLWELRHEGEKVSRAAHERLWESYLAERRSPKGCKHNEPAQARAAKPTSPPRGARAVAAGGSHNEPAPPSASIIQEHPGFRSRLRKQIERDIKASRSITPLDLRVYTRMVVEAPREALGALLRWAAHKEPAVSGPARVAAWHLAFTLGPQMSDSSRISPRNRRTLTRLVIEAARDPKNLKRSDPLTPAAQQLGGSRLIPVFLKHARHPDPLVQRRAFQFLGAFHDRKAVGRMFRARLLDRKLNPGTANDLVTALHQARRSKALMALLRRFLLALDDGRFAEPPWQRVIHDAGRLWEQHSGRHLGFGPPKKAGPRRCGHTALMQGYQRTRSLEILGLGRPPKNQASKKPSRGAAAKRLRAAREKLRRARSAPRR